MAKIILCIDTNTAGGGERVIATLANYFANKNHRVILVNSDTDSNHYSIHSDVEVKKMQLDKCKSNGIKRILKKYVFLKKLFLEEQPDAVITFLFNMEAPCILAGLRTHTNVFTSVRNSANAYPKLQRLFRRIMYPHIAGVVFQSRRVQHHSDYYRLRNSIIIMNPLSYELSEDIPPVKYILRNNKIICIGRLTEQKNPCLLLDAFCDIRDAYPELELHYFGDGPLRKEIKEQIIIRGLEGKVYLEGIVDNAAFINRDAKMFVMTSNYEGFPNALVESMSQGIPCICTDFDSGVAAELIKDKVNGCLCRVNDKQSVVEAMRYILDLGSRTDDMSKEASNIRALLSTEKICKQWEDFIIR